MGQQQTRTKRTTKQVAFLNLSTELDRGKSLLRIHNDKSWSLGWFSARIYVTFGLNSLDKEFNLLRLRLVVH